MNSGAFCILLRFSFLIPGLLLFRVAIAQDIYIVNPFVQPNDSTLNWYGSGDANGDDTLTTADLTGIQEYINGSFSDSNDKRLNDRMDVNGDEIVNQEDYNIMQNHFENRAPRDPEFYWANRTPEQKQDWLVKMLAIDKTNEIPPKNDPVWDCTQYSNQLMINFNGFSNPKDIEDLKKVYDYNFKDNGRFNLQVLDAYLRYYDSSGVDEGGHEMNTIFLKENILGWENQTPIEPQFDQIDVQIGQAYLSGKNTKYSIRGSPSKRILPFPNQPELEFTYYIRYLIKDQLPDEGNIHSDILYGDIDLITEKTPEQLGITTNIDSETNYEVSPSINIDISDSKLKKAWVTDGLTKKVLQNGNNTVNFDFPEGENEIRIYAKDIFDRDTIYKQSITIQDIFPPRINITSPEPNETYGSSPIIIVNIEEPNLKQAQYSLDSGSTWIEFARDITFTPNLNLGDHTLLVGAEDSAGNDSINSVSFTVADLDAPSAPTGLIAENITTNSFDLFWDSSMDNVGVSGYRVFIGDTEEGISSSNSYSFQDLSPNTGYSVALSAYDEVGNESAISSSITVTTVDPTVGNEVLAEFLGQVKIYPNPIYDQLHIETKDILQYSIEISSINGQLVYNQEVAGLIHQIDFSSFQKGVYFITIRAQDSVTTRKILKL